MAFDVGCSLQDAWQGPSLFTHRETAQEHNFVNQKLIDPMEALGRFDTRPENTKAGLFNELVPFEEPGAT